MSATPGLPSCDDLAALLRAAGCVFAEDEAALLLAAARSADHLRAMVDQRLAGLPLEPILGWAEFFGLRIAVDPGVFVPRRRTELLVREALALLPMGEVPVLLDLCCGSGAVGLAVAMVQGEAWRAAWPSTVPVACAFQTPRLRRVAGGWVPTV